MANRNLTELEVFNMMQFLMGDFETSWEKCFPIWKQFGRVEDYPHGIRLPAYWPNFAKRLGTEFVRTFYDEPEPYIVKLNDVDEQVRLIAYDLIELLVWERHSNKDPIPETLLELEVAIPLTALNDIRAEELFSGFTGTTVKEFLPLFLAQGE